jgi:non-ribosomal peptide synthetase component E (peptide arylation enzyme)
MLGQRAARDPARTALLCGEQRVSFGELWNRVVASACYLADRGVRPGERALLEGLVSLYPYQTFLHHNEALFSPASVNEEVRIEFRRT